MDISLDKLPAWTHEKSKIQSSETSPKAHGDSNIGKVPMSKDEDLSLGVQYPYKNTRVEACICKPSPGEAETDRSISPLASH